MKRSLSNVMNALRCIVLLPYLAILSAGQSTPSSSAASSPNQPETLVQKLYQQVIARGPIGTMTKKERKVFAPYLSKMLNRKIDLTKACEADYFRQHPDPNVKPPFVWGENGTFTGSDDGAPQSFQIEKSEPEKDGSINVSVRLRYRAPPEKSWLSRVVVVVKQENGNFVVDDVIYLGEDDSPSNERFSKVLSHGCEAGHWIDTK